uniref:Glycosyltransferase family 92 protein n=2 Tax=Lygus hesperus TaxID=30085 RepID=A0A0A9YC52_LYGHE
MVSRIVKRSAFVLFLWVASVLVLLNVRGFTQSILSHQPGSRGLLHNLPNTLNPADGSSVLLQLSPNVDSSQVNVEHAMYTEIEQKLPSLPLAYLSKNSKMFNVFQKNESCAKFPSLYDIEFNNIYWQSLSTSNGTFYLYSAYYDIRKMSKIGPAVRILAMINRIEPAIKTHCQFWFENKKEPVFVKVMEYKYIWYKKWGNYKQGIFQPYLIACQIPEPYHSKVPLSVSIVEKVCDNATNNLRVIYNKPPKKGGFAVCVKGLDFQYTDLSVRMVEWIELLGLLGAEKIFFYELQVHQNISKVLKYYQERGKIDVTPLTLPGGQPNIPGFQHMYLSKKINHKRQNELIPYNDCLYRNLYSYEYIALLDIDEVIMPVKTSSWRELMDTVLVKARQIKNETRASYNVRNVYFLDDLIHSHGWFKDIPQYMHMLQHVYRSKNYTKPNMYVKCFHNPERALILHNHFPLACLGSTCTTYPIETNDAQLQHYRADCVKTLKKSCTEFRQNSILDTTIWKFKDALVSRTTEALLSLGYFPSYNQMKFS